LFDSGDGHKKYKPKIYHHEKTEIKNRICDIRIGGDPASNRAGELLQSTLCQKAIH
jgi:hypothetical protein